MTLCAGCLLTASAQSSFTQRLQQSNTGEGKVTVTHDKTIDELVNGSGNEAVTQPKTVSTQPKTVATQPSQPKTSTQGQTEQQTTEPAQRPTATEHQTILPDTTTITSEETRKKVMKGGYKINGYRVQVFAGGNSRDARLKAEKAGKEINSLFPGEPVYVHFYSPRWICRMGNYRTYEEAHQVLNAVKNLGYQSAIIVKGKITVPYLTTNEP